MQETNVGQAELLELMVNQNREIIERLDRLERAQALTVVRESYTTEQVADRLERTEWTVRQWCNQGQAEAAKVRGKGRTGEWRITHEEFVRLQNEGPLPKGTFDNKGRRQGEARRRTS
jgi:predicted transcriptional regulator